MSSQFIYDESRRIFSQSSKHLGFNIYYIILPTINKINELSVKCGLTINKISTSSKNKYFIGLTIESDKISYSCADEKYNLYSHSEKLPAYTSNEIYKFLLKVKNNILPNIKLDIVFGKFVLINADGKKNIKKENVGEDIFGLEYSNCSQCSVCYESTYTRTNCNHELCVDCWNKINNNSCPICRSILIMRSEYSEGGKKDEESDDDDVDDWSYEIGDSEDSEDGENGEDGEDGEDSEDSEDGEDGEDGEDYLENVGNVENV